MPDIKEKIGEGRQAIGEFARTAQAGLGERAGQLREQARDYGDGALEQYGQARTYVVERIQDKPVSAVLAVLGVGVVLGVLLGLASQRTHYD